MLISPKKTKGSIYLVHSKSIVMMCVILFNTNLRKPNIENAISFAASFNY
jgi:hypothetical protein